MITQAKDQSLRLKDWILYHYEEGFDTFIYFDDYSEDDSLDNINNISQKYNINIIVKYSDGLGNRKSRSAMSDSNSYGGDTSINYRIIRSYNQGLNLVRQNNPSAICAFLDVDEFLVSNTGRVSDVIDQLMFEKKTGHLYIHSFDIDDKWIAEDWYSCNENTKFRWSYESRLDSAYKYRGKSVCVASEIIEIPQGPNYVHSLRDCDSEYIEKINILEHDSLRIHHFRTPCLDNKIEFIEDTTLIDKMTKIKNNYDFK